SSDLTHTHTHTPISYWHSDQRLVMEGKGKCVVCDMNSRESSSYPSPPLWILKPHVIDKLLYKSVTQGNVSLFLSLSVCLSLSLSLSVRLHLTVSAANRLAVTRGRGAVLHSHLSIYLFIHVSVCLLVCQSIYSSAFLSLFPSLPLPPPALSLSRYDSSVLT